MSMFYTNLFLVLAVFLGGCASTPSTLSSMGMKIETAKPNNKASHPAGNLVTFYQNALTELNNNNLEIAKKMFLEIIKMQPDLAGPWANLALIDIKQERYEKAENNIGVALNNNPQMVQALNIAGVIENRKGNINKAKYYYEKAIAKKPAYALAHYNLALLYDIYLQDIAKAINHYQQYLSLLDHEDKRTKSWVKELKLNLSRGNR